MKHIKINVDDIISKLDKLETQIMQLRRELLQLENSTTIEYDCNCIHNSDECYASTHKCVCPKKCKVDDNHICQCFHYCYNLHKNNMVNGVCYSRYHKCVCLYNHRDNIKLRACFADEHLCNCKSVSNLNFINNKKSNISNCLASVHMCRCTETVFGHIFDYATDPFCEDKTKMLHMIVCYLCKIGKNKLASEMVKYYFTLIMYSQYIEDDNYICKNIQLPYIRYHSVCPTDLDQLVSNLGLLKILPDICKKDKNSTDKIIFSDYCNAYYHEEVEVEDILPVYFKIREHIFDENESISN